MLKGLVVYVIAAIGQHISIGLKKDCILYLLCDSLALKCVRFLHFSMAILKHQEIIVKCLQIHKLFLESRCHNQNLFLSVIKIVTFNAFILTFRMTMIFDIHPNIKLHFWTLHSKTTTTKTYTTKINSILHFEEDTYRTPGIDAGMLSGQNAMFWDVYTE